MALEVVGSTPINHPIKQKHPAMGAFALWESGIGGRKRAIGALIRYCKSGYAANVSLLWKKHVFSLPDAVHFPLPNAV